MGKFDDEVEQRGAELRAEGRVEAELERREIEAIKQAAESLADRIERRVASRRLAFNVVPADEALDQFARFVVEVRHRKSDIVLGHILQRDVGQLTGAPPQEGDLPPPSTPRIASFFAPLVLYRDCEFDGFACQTIDEIDAVQFDEAAFVEWLYDELVELTAAHEQEYRG